MRAGRWRGTALSLKSLLSCPYWPPDNRTRIARSRRWLRHGENTDIPRTKLLRQEEILGTLAGFGMGSSFLCPYLFL
jgi:hypothetical protein